MMTSMGGQRWGMFVKIGFSLEVERSGARMSAYDAGFRCLSAGSGAGAHGAAAGARGNRALTMPLSSASGSFDVTPARELLR
jgi:hypothetical protein